MGRRTWPLGSFVFFAFSQPTLCRVVSVTSHTHPLLFYTDLRPDIHLLQVYSFTFDKRSFSDLSDQQRHTRCAAHSRTSARPSPVPRLRHSNRPPSSQQSHATHTTASADRNHAMASNGAAPPHRRTVAPIDLAMHRYAPRPRPSLTDSPRMRQQVDLRSIATDSDSATRRVNRTAPRAQVLAQQRKPASTENQTAAACRKSHRVPSLSHERSQPVRRHARVPHFDFDDSAPRIGSPACRCDSG